MTSVTNNDAKAVSTIINARSALTDDALRDITDWDSAVAIMEAAGVEIESFSDYGSGFTVENKKRLVGVPFFIAEWRFNVSDLNDDGFVSASVLTKAGEKWIINDGSSGIRAQLQSVTRARIARKNLTPQNGLLVPGGLTRSDYDYTDEKGKTIPATTYYLSDAVTV